MDTTAPPRIRLYWSALSTPSAMPVCPMMNENSPIWERPAAMVSEVRAPAENSAPSAMLISHLPAMMRATSAASSRACAVRVAGFTIMPTDAKKMMEKRSWKGIASAATRCESFEVPTTTPARKAPSATERSNSTDAAMAVPSAMTTTASWNSSRGQRRAILASSHGRTRDPTASMRATKATVLTRASAMPPASWAGVVSPGPNTTGSTTRITTVARSSTISQPVAMRPPRLW